MLMDLESSLDIDNACCVDEAFKKLSTGKYDVVISDYEMPLKNGLEFLKELREQKNDVAFIIFTGRGREDVAVQALNLGADRYLNKNGAPEAVYSELFHALKNIVERKKSRELVAKSESKYHALVENSLQGIAILQVAPIRIVFANSALGKILGYSSEELTSLSPKEIMSLVYQEDRAVFFKRMENRLRGEPADACFEFRAVRKDSSIIWLSSLANRVDYDGQPAVQGMFLDVNESKKAAEILSESEQRYRELANCLPDIVFETDLNGQVEFANERAAEISGYSLDEVERGLNIFQFIVPEDRNRATKNIQRLLSGGSSVPSEYKFMRKDGTTFPALITATPRVCKNKVTGFRGMVLDISERKKAEEVVEKSEARFRELANFLPEIVFETDLSGKITFFSQTAFEILGFTPGELEKGVNMLQFVVPEDRERAKENIRRRMAGEKSDTSEYMLFRKNGDTYPAIVKTAPIYSENKLNGLRGLVIDITERKKVEEALANSEAKYRALVENADDTILLTDLRGKHIYRNRAYYKSLGYEEGDNIKLDELSKVHPDDVPIIKEKMNELLKTGSIVSEYRIKHRDGRWLHRFAKSSLIYNVHNQPYAILAIIRDVTEGKMAEQELKESEEKYKTLFEQAGDYTLILEAQATGVPVIFDANISALQIHGYTREEIIGKPITFLDEESGNEQGMERLNKLLSNQKLTFEAKHSCKDGSTIDVEVSIKNVKVGSKNFLVSVERDITERKKNEDALRQERGMLESVTKNIGAGLVMISKDYKILWMNNFLRQFTGASENDHCYSSFNTCTTICPDCGPKKIFEGADFDSREYYNQTEFNKDHPVWFELIATPIKDKDGNVVAALELTVNITEKKAAEKKLKENSDKIDLMNEKLRVVGSLTRHDVANKLMAAKSNVYLLKKKLGENAELTKYFDGIESAFNGSDRIFEFSCLYEKIGAEKPSKENVFECFNQAVALMANLGSVKVANECQGLEVVADSLLKQLFYNFIDNSLKHGEKVTQIRLHYTEDKNGLKLFYEDNGVGVLEVNKPKLFEVGFTTGKGSGLGLYLVKKMMDVYGWRIEENGEPGTGAKFTIIIPKSNQNGKESFQIS